METLQELIDELAWGGEAPAIIAAEGETWSRDRLRSDALHFAAGLAAASVQPRQVIGLLAPSKAEWVVALLGIVRSGAIAMPLNEQMGERELERVIEHSGCRMLITTAPLATRTPAFDRLSQLILLDDEVPPDFEHRHARSWRTLLQGDQSDLPEIEADQPTVLLYTSGTTGTPKGVPLTHGNLCANLQALQAAGLASSEDRVLLPLPLHHAYPLTVGLLAPLAVGAAVVLPAGITGPQIMHALRDHRCTIMIAVPRLYEAMLAGIERQIAGAPRPIAAALRGLLDLAVWIRRRLGRRIGKVLFFPLHRRIGPALRLLASGGARLDPKVAWQLEGLGWEVLTGYGLTETAPILTFNPPGRARIESAGLAVEGVELRLGPAEDAEPGHGEILAKGPNVFSGYWDNPEATAEAFTDDGYLPHRRPRLSRRRLSVHRRAQQGADRPLRRREHLSRRGRSGLRRGRPGAARSRCWSTTTAWSRCSCPIRKRCAHESQDRAAPAFPPRGRAALAAAAVVCAHRRFRDHRPAACHVRRSASCAGTSCPRSLPRRSRARVGRSPRRP